MDIEIENSQPRCARMRQSAVILLAVALGLSTISTDAAFSESSGESKLAIGNIVLNPMPDGLYTANVNLYLRRGNSPQINFSVSVQRVKTIDEVYDKLRPSVDHLADELRNAEIERPH